jgi:hypothetical protein
MLIPRWDVILLSVNPSDIGLSWFHFTITVERRYFGQGRLAQGH